MPKNKECACCRSNNRISSSKYCDFCSKVSKQVINNIIQRKKNETAVDYKIRFRLFEKIKNLHYFFDLNGPEVVISHGLYLFINYYEISEYNHCLQIDEENKEVNLIDVFNEITKCYFENRENDLPYCLEKFKICILKSKYSKDVKENLKKVQRLSFCLTSNFCLDCGEGVEKYMKDGYCQACTMLGQALDN